jgi:hypothetical protein
MILGDNKKEILYPQNQGVTPFAANLANKYACSFSPLGIFFT